MQTKQRILVAIKFLSEGPPEETEVEFAGLNFRILEHNIGWNFRTAEALIKKYDEYADGIILSGLPKKVTYGATEISYQRAMGLMKLAKSTRVYMGSGVLEFFGLWNIRRILKKCPEFLKGRKALFHSTISTPYAKAVAEAGARIAGADPLFFFNQPVLLRGESQVLTFLQGFRAVLATKIIEQRKDMQRQKNRFEVQERLASWIQGTDIFITYRSLIEDWKHLECLRDKAILLDYAPEELRRRLVAAGVGQIVELVPNLPGLDNFMRYSTVIQAILDQLRIAEDSVQSLEEFSLQFFASELKNAPFPITYIKQVPRRCAFVIHPLSKQMFAKGPGLSWLSSASEGVLDTIENVATYLPGMKLGEITGIRSELTGQEVICDLYSLFSTPKKLLEGEEETTYDKLVAISEKAEKSGALLMGLGAYTKVVGDNGVTVARRAPIPVTTGNSYTVAATLWAANLLVRRLGITRISKDGKQTEGMAMVIGATGSIGRVCSLLLSFAVKELVLVGTRPDKLMELREEIAALRPDVSVHITTDAQTHIARAELIITSTSSQGKKVLDIMQVRPGAVICDCSRPIDVTEEDAKRRPDVLVIESGEIALPGKVKISMDIGLEGNAVYACLAETVLLTLEGRYEPFSLSRNLSFNRVKQIYKIGLAHGAQLASVRGPLGPIHDETIETVRRLAKQRLESWQPLTPLVRPRKSVSKATRVQSKHQSKENPL